MCDQELYPRPVENTEQPASENSGSVEEDSTHGPITYRVDYRNTDDATFYFEFMDGPFDLESARQGTLSKQIVLEITTVLNTSVIDQDRWRGNFKEDKILSDPTV